MRKCKVRLEIVFDESYMGSRDPSQMPWESCTHFVPVVLDTAVMRLDKNQAMTASVLSISSE